MSATTSTSTVQTVENEILAAEPMIIMLFAGKLGPINTTLQGAVTGLSSEAVAMLSEAKVALDKAETSNPAVVKLVQIVTTGLSGLGITVTTEGNFFAHLTAAVNDLLAAVVPPAAAAPASA